MIIGITGTDGAGKGAIVEILKEKGFTHYSAREIILSEIERRGVPQDREHMRIIANDLRKGFGNDVIVKRSLERKEREGKDDVVIESIRACDEAVTLKENGGVLVSIDADQNVRYERIQSRASESDKITFEEFVSQEELEMNDPDPHGMQKAKVIEMADFTIMNDGDMDELRGCVNDFLEKYN